MSKDVLIDQLQSFQKAVQAGVDRTQFDQHVQELRGHAQLLSDGALRDTVLLRIDRVGRLSFIYSMDPEANQRNVLDQLRAIGLVLRQGEDPLNWI